MRVKRWTEEQLKQVVKLNETMTHNEMSKVIGKSRVAIRYKLYMMRKKGLID